jgi:hypothetical protein
MFFLILISVLGAALTAFMIIARKGRKLRTAHVLPDQASRATFESADGRQYSVEPKTHFYFGRNPECQIVLGNLQEEYEVCVFYHRKRFAFETLSSSRGIQVNGEEQMAGYLKTGDVLEIGGETFTFKGF